MSKHLGLFLSTDTKLNILTIFYVKKGNIKHDIMTRRIKIATIGSNINNNIKKVISPDRILS